MDTIDCALVGTLDGEENLGVCGNGTEIDTTAFVERPTPVAASAMYSTSSSMEQQLNIALDVRNMCNATLVANAHDIYTYVLNAHLNPDNMMSLSSLKSFSILAI
mmetsp:Transcript_51750/g.62345  ORF Transcript_51750/g.62345 Transcript_51750/m.62345 type:complete len:105 (+) Transcript_51750:950-1264(+)